MSETDAVKEDLLETDDDFRRLYDEHQDYERRLEVIHRKSLPSQDDEIEIKRIKVHKLVLKDRMEAMLRERRAERATA